MIARGNVRRGVLGLIAAGLLAGVATAIVVLPSAKGEPTPEPTPTDTATATAAPTPTATPAADPCLASNLTETISKVNAGISQYLQSHPETNAALADVARQSPFSAQSAFTAWFDARPEEAAALHTLQQPLVDLSNQCGYQVTPGQVLGALSDL